MYYGFEKYFYFPFVLDYNNQMQSTKIRNDGKNDASTKNSPTKNEKRNKNHKTQNTKHKNLKSHQRVKIMCITQKIFLHVFISSHEDKDYIDSSWGRAR